MLLNIDKHHAIKKSQHFHQVFTLCLNGHLPMQPDQMQLSILPIEVACQ
jgi:hypothetical protein